MGSFMHAKGDANVYAAQRAFLWALMCASAVIVAKVCVVELCILCVEVYRSLADFHKRVNEYSAVYQLNS